MVEGYQFRVYLWEISPAIWRCLLLRDDQTIADLHYTLQSAMSWSDYHLNRFIIHGKQFGVYHIGGMSFSDDPHEVCLRDFRFRPRERFLYEYDFGDRWQHEIRLERKLPLDPKKTYPICIGGAGERRRKIAAGRQPLWRWRPTIRCLTSQPGCGKSLTRAGAMSVGRSCISLCTGCQSMSLTGGP